MADMILHQISPLFSCRDLPAALESYRNLLGFAPRFRRGDEFAIVTRGDVEIHLQASPNPQEKFGLGAATLMVSGLEEFYDEFSAAGANVLGPIQKAPDGVQLFEVQDDDGNKLVFTQAVP